mgnify:CR=1 FL=1
MKLSIGIVGLPNVGKSTLFKLLTQNDVNIANYPFCTIDPNIGVVPVPDERVDKLAALSRSKKVIPAIVEFYDIAGLVKGAATGEGLGNKFLSHIKEVKAIVQVLRCFPEGEIIHVENSVDPMRDMDIINTELTLADAEIVDRRLKKAEGEARTGAKDTAKSFEVLKKVKAKLDGGELIAEFSDEPVVKELQLLTAKKQLYLLNGKPEDVPAALTEKIKTLGADFIVADLSSGAHLADTGQMGVSGLIAAAYKILNLMSFFTTGEDETRAWTVERGTKAPQAAGAIHTDFEKKFIRAEVILWSKLLEAGGWSAAKAKGLLRLEGKNYVMADGDVVEIRHG